LKDIVNAQAILSWWHMGRAFQGVVVKHAPCMVIS
jgi:hypothetical protein